LNYTPKRLLIIP